jgi:hypothetical protein
MSNGVFLTATKQNLNTGKTATELAIPFQNHKLSGAFFAPISQVRATAMS